MPIITRSISHSGRVGITNFVLVTIILFDKSVTDKKPDHKKLPSRITHPIEARGTQIVA
jgi:hypothetical protein